MLVVAGWEGVEFLVMHASGADMMHVINLEPPDFLPSCLGYYSECQVPCSELRFERFQGVALRRVSPLHEQRHTREPRGG